MSLSRQQMQDIMQGRLDPSALPTGQNDQLKAVLQRWGRHYSIGGRFNPGLPGAGGQANDGSSEEVDQAQLLEWLADTAVER